MSTDEQHVALPTLYGAPAYARPPSVADTKDRPFDPDELPIEADQTEEERAFASSLPPRAYAPGGVQLEVGRAATAEPSRRRGRGARPLALREIAGRLLRP
ncbi:MAG: hypothetical protein ACJ779_06155 [Chloroflexota bacterium]